MYDRYGLLNLEFTKHFLSNVNDKYTNAERPNISGLANYDANKNNKYHNQYFTTNNYKL